MEAKIVLKSSNMVQDLDAYYSRGHCLSYNTFSKVQTQESSNKSKETQLKDTNSTSPRDNTIEPAKKKKKKDKKKKFQKYK